MSDDFNPDVFQVAASSQEAFIKQYVPSDDDQGVLGNFETVKEFKPFKSQQEHKEIFEDETYVRIKIRGNDKLEVFRRCTDVDKKRFPFAWQQFQSGQEQGRRGTPIVQLSGMDSSMVVGYNAKNVYTVEDLAAVSDNFLGDLGTGARELRYKARQYVDEHKQIAQSSQAVERLKAFIEKQTEQLNALAAENAALKAKRGPGRPPKEE